MEQDAAGAQRKTELVLLKAQPTAAAALGSAGRRASRASAGASVAGADDRMGCVPSKQRAAADAAFAAIDTDRSSKIDEGELAHWIAEQQQLWAMLDVNLGLGEERCKQIATDVAFRMSQAEGEASPKPGAKREMTADEFARFHEVVADPKGQLSFFHQTARARAGEPLGARRGTRSRAGGPLGARRGSSSTLRVK